jgi:hypothetical protein
VDGGSDVDGVMLDLSENYVTTLIEENSSNIINLQNPQDHSGIDTALDLQHVVGETPHGLSDKSSTMMKRTKLCTNVFLSIMPASLQELLIEKSHNFKGTSNLLCVDKDKYAITPCSE